MEFVQKLWNFQNNSEFRIISFNSIVDEIRFHLDVTLKQLVIQDCHLLVHLEVSLLFFIF